MPILRADGRIGVHHIGARGGAPAAWLASELFADDFVTVLYEPDPAAVDMGDAVPKGSRVLPYALGNRDGDADLYVAFDGYASSLYPPAAGHDDEVLAAGYDHDVPALLRTVQTVRIPLRRLDGLPSILDEAPPNAISLDVQGGELDVLRGGAQALGAHLLAGLVEVSFEEYYEGQPLAGEIMRWLAGIGMRFAGFVSIERHYRYRMPLGLRGLEAQVAADGLFLRKLDALAPDDPAIVALAFLAHLSQHHDVGFAALDRADARLFADPELRKRRYVGFLQALGRAREQMPVLYPPQFHEAYTEEESAARFDPARRDEMRALADARARAFGRAITEQHRDALTHLLSAGDSPVEGCFRAYEMPWIADALKTTRIGSTRGVLEAFGVTVSGG